METRTFTYTIQPRLESTFPTDFMDTGDGDGDRDFMGRRDKKPQADTVAATMDPATAPLTDEPLNWTIWSGDDLLMTSTFEVCFNICPQISKLNYIPCRRRRMSLQMRRRKIRLNQAELIIFEEVKNMRHWLFQQQKNKLLVSSFSNAVAALKKGRDQQMCGCGRKIYQGIYKAR